jgi:LAO/AO transport system kinase
MQRGFEKQNEFWHLIVNLMQNDVEPLSKRLGKALSLAENADMAISKSIELRHPPALRPHVFVIVGPSGVGKSVLIDRLVPYFLKDFKSIVVLATDPTSTLSGGALLGDRVRFSNNEKEQQVFYRSVASRGSSKAFSESIPAMIDVIALFQIDAVIVETMGVAQQDSSSNAIADTLINILGPSAGDEIQLYKSGVLEYGDIFFINKSDVDNSDSNYSLLKMKLNQNHKHQKSDFPKVLRGSAVEKQGVEELYNSMYLHMQKVKNLEAEVNL